MCICKYIKVKYFHDYNTILHKMCSENKKKSLDFPNIWLHLNDIESRNTLIYNQKYLIMLKYLKFPSKTTIRAVLITSSDDHT